MTNLISTDDEGELQFAMALDRENNLIRIQFPKPVYWLGLDLQSATEIRDGLNEKIQQLEENIN